MLTPFFPDPRTSFNEEMNKKVSKIAALFRDNLMLMQLDKAFNDLMADAITLQTSTNFRELSPQIKYKFEMHISEVCEPHWSDGRKLPGGVYHMQIICRIFMVPRNNVTERLEYVLTSELSIPGKRKPIIAAMGTPQDILDCYADANTNFVKTAVNFYKRYRDKHPENLARSIVQTAYTTDGSASQGNAARRLIAEMEQLNPFDLRDAAMRAPLPVIPVNGQPTDESEAWKLLGAANIRDVRHAEPDEVGTEELPQDVIADMNDPRTLANLLKGIK